MYRCFETLKEIIMKKKLLLGALCIVMALSLVSCDWGNLGKGKDPEIEYLIAKGDGPFEIPDWIKGYWSDATDDTSSAESFFFTDTNFFNDVGRKKSHDFKVIAQLSDDFEETATETTYTVTFKNYWSQHTNKDWVFTFTKTVDGISLVENKGDNDKNFTLEKGKLLIPEWLRGSWSAGGTRFNFTKRNMVRVLDSDSVDFTDVILPCVNGKYYEYKKDTGYIEKRNDDETPKSYELIVQDEEGVFINMKFVQKDENTVTWYSGDRSVDLTAVSE